MLDLLPPQMSEVASPLLEHVKHNQRWRVVVHNFLSAQARVAVSYDQVFRKAIAWMFLSCRRSGSMMIRSCRCLSWKMSRNHRSSAKLNHLGHVAEKLRYSCGADRYRPGTAAAGTGRNRFGKSRRRGRAGFAGSQAYAIPTFILLPRIWQLCHNFCL